MCTTGSVCDCACESRLGDSGHAALRRGRLPRYAATNRDTFFFAYSPPLTRSAPLPCIPPGFLFWTSVTALGPMIFYSAVWAMGLSGDEILLFCCISPFFLLFPPLRSWFARPGIANLGVLIAVASVYAGDTDGEAGASEGEGAARLRWTGLGLAWATMGHVASWWHVRMDDRMLENRTT